MCDLGWFVVVCVVVCSGLWWFVVVCGGLWWFVVFSATLCFALFYQIDPLVLQWNFVAY